MRARTVVARGAAGIGVGVLPFLLDLGVAGADSTAAHSVDHQFTTTGGAMVTCTVHGESTIFGTSSDARRRAQAVTSAFGPSSACAPGFANVIVTYTNSSNEPAEGSAGAFSDGVTWSGNDVLGSGAGFSARHLYRFEDCTTDCTVEFITAPK